MFDEIAIFAYNKTPKSSPYLCAICVSRRLSCAINLPRFPEHVTFMKLGDE